MDFWSIYLFSIDLWLNKSENVVGSSSTNKTNEKKICFVEKSCQFQKTK